ncbi:MAG: hypothetical protein C4334_07935 [Pyrinomonas sp.]|uniref:B12-binding domain-containing radical SAM protein n=1 Tax=Pyrinomonas sp. TaxID=2080306 RepID=UPI003330B669
MFTVVIADLEAKGGYVNKDTIAGGYGSRFYADSFYTRMIVCVRRAFQRLPSPHVGYLAAIFARYGHRVVVTRGEPTAGDLALVLTSLVDYKHEREWAARARARGMRVGFFGTPATFMPELFADIADFVIIGEPEAAAERLARGEELRGLVQSPAIEDLDSLPFPRWDLVEVPKLGYTNRRRMGLARAVPMLTSRSCPEHCTYCPHRITAKFRARSVSSVVAEMEEICALFHRPHIVIRDPIFTLDRQRCLQLADEMQRRSLSCSFECETRMDDLDEELIASLHAAGLRGISFGVESPDPHVLKRVGRRYIPPEHIRRMVTLCWQRGIKTTAFYVFGFLQDTEESIRETIRFACDLDTAYANFKILTPYPGTPLFKQLRPLIFERDWEKFDGYTLTFTHPQLSPQRARLLLGMAYSRFYGRPSQLFNLFGWHALTHTRPVQTLDDLAWRAYDHFDRRWMQEGAAPAQEPVDLDASRRMTA